MQHCSYLGCPLSYSLETKNTSRSISTQLHLLLLQSSPSLRVEIWIHSEKPCNSVKTSFNKPAYVYNEALSCVSVIKLVWNLISIYRISLNSFLKYLSPVGSMIKFCFTTFWFLRNIKHHNHATFMNQKVVTQNFIIEPTGDKYFRRLFL